MNYGCLNVTIGLYQDINKKFIIKIYQSKFLSIKL